MKFSFGILCVLISVSAHAQHPANPCTVASYYGTPCLENLTQNTNSAGSTLISLTPSATMPSQGTTVASVNTNYMSVILWEFETESAATLNAQMTQFDSVALARFSHQYWLASDGNLGSLMELAAQKLTATNLARWSAAFGAEMTAWAVDTYSPPAVRVAYESATKPAIIPESHAAHIALGQIAMTMSGKSGGVVLNTNMTLYEIYTEYLWQGAETTAEAFVKTAIFAKTNLGAAFMAGYSIGSSWYAFAITIDPDYGYDLVTTYGAADPSNVVIDGATTTTGAGYVDDPDFYDVGYWDFSESCVFMGTC